MGRFAESLHITQVAELTAVNCMKYCWNWTLQYCC